MVRVAVFVDAGYLFAAGSALLAGSKQSRSLLTLQDQAIVTELKRLAEATSGAQLLRIYWYDGAFGSGPTAEHNRLASLDNVKVRLGYINSAGQQKGVDSLIVTDLIDLARNRALADAVLVSGDEDVRVGVQIAQSFGVRVHLLGIEPSRSNQSLPLRQEVDTRIEWEKATVDKLLAVRNAAAPSTPVATPARTSTAPPPVAVRSPATAPLPSNTTALEAIVEAVLLSLNPGDMSELQALLGAGPGVPQPWDKTMLVQGRKQFDRDLTRDEIRYLRKRFIAQAKGRPSPK